MDPAEFVPVAAAVRRYPHLEGLRDLATTGVWRFTIAEDPDGRLQQLNGFRCWPQDVTDAIAVHSETSVRALRIIGDENGIVWTREGDLGQVVAELLELPAPGTPNAPRLVVGRTPTLWTPNQNR